ncbi:HET domain-containing protein [Paraphaeosphaeria sporulosa]
MAEKALPRPPPSFCGRIQFTHQPLDHTKPSIHLLEVLPDLLPDGLIQCTRFHATIEAGHTYLSYMWDPLDLPKQSHVIVVNGSKPHVRRNLFDILGVIRKLQNLRKVYWIDAICINQNDGVERNHQVQQMGDIYLKAACVVTWLGNCDNIPASDIPEVIMDIVRPILDGKTRKSAKGNMKYKYSLFRCTFDNPYWRRAWVTHEIRLALHHMAMLGCCQIAFNDPTSLFGEVRRWDAAQDKKILQVESKFDFLKEISRNVDREDALINLMDDFYGRECSVRQDRVFSLLSFCNESTKLSVDYSCSKEDLMYRILDTHGPLPLCFCCALALAQNLELADPTSCRRKLGPCIEVILDPFPKDSDLITRAGDRYFFCRFVIDTQWLHLQIRRKTPVLRWNVYCISRYRRLKIYCDKVKDDMAVKVLAEYGLESTICQYGEGIELSPLLSEERWHFTSLSI